jgi:hypothetical protein
MLVLAKNPRQEVAPGTCVPELMTGKKNSPPVVIPPGAFVPHQLVAPRGDWVPDQVVLEKEKPALVVAPPAAWVSDQFVLKKEKPAPASGLSFAFPFLGDKEEGLSMLRLPPSAGAFVAVPASSSSDLEATKLDV